MRQRRNGKCCGLGGDARECHEFANEHGWSPEEVEKYDLVLANAVEDRR
jgi:hypothetical protein